jgi:uncharacterized lipoprotein YmbA
MIHARSIGSGLSCAALAAVLRFTASSCSIRSPGKDEARFAVLASVDEMPGATGAMADSQAPASSVRFGLGPITLPDYLLRTEIVTRRDGTRIVPSPTEHWSEPFDRAVERVLGIDLERALGAGRIAHYPWYRSDRPDVQIQIAFARCEREESGKVVLAARWTVRGLDDEAKAIERESRIERQAASAAGSSTALALSQALADLAAEIAQASSGLSSAVQASSAQNPAANGKAASGAEPH